MGRDWITPTHITYCSLHRRAVMLLLPNLPKVPWNCHAKLNITLNQSQPIFKNIKKSIDFLLKHTLVYSADCVNMNHSLRVTRAFKPTPKTVSSMVLLQLGLFLPNFNQCRCFVYQHEADHWKTLRLEGQVGQKLDCLQRSLIFRLGSTPTHSASCLEVKNLVKLLGQMEQAILFPLLQIVAEKMRWTWGKEQEKPIWDAKLQL